MIIIDALKLASSEHVVYFLLTAYVETVEHRGLASRALPKEAKRMPVRDADDIMRRLRVLQAKRPAANARREAKMIDDVVAAFSAAAEKLRALGARVSAPGVGQSVRYSLIAPLRSLLRPPRLLVWRARRDALAC
jgi:hypothetical protein